MVDPMTQPQALLADARELVARLEAGDTDGADEILDRFSNEREQVLFEEIGQLTRRLHETLNDVLFDGRITQLAETDIPDARERLNHVLTLTEQAAHRTLNAVEEGMPLAKSLQDDARDLDRDWQRFVSRQMEAEDFRDLCRRLTAWFEAAANTAGSIHAHLSEALMAQDYQDLTGQIIRRVIDLGQDVEQQLARLVQLSGRHVKVQREGATGLELEGPQIPGRESDGAVSGQDDVDALLAGYGF